MPKSPNQKLKLIYLIKIFSEKTDENHYLTAAQLIEELEKVESSKDDFVANVSHEIRTPINTICGMSEVILNEDNYNKLKKKNRERKREDQ